jgi:hypothetical protein
MLQQFLKVRSICLLLATIGAIIIFWALAPGGWSDRDATDYQAFYRPVARNLLAGRGLVTEKGEPAVRYPPGYPLILAGLFWLSDRTGIGERYWVQGFTLLAMGLSCVFLYEIARRVVGERAGFLTGLLWAIYPLNLWIAKMPDSTIPFLLVFYGALLAFMRILWGDWPKPWVSLAMGLLIGYASLVRPIGILTGVLLASLILIMRWKDRSRHHVLLTITLLLLGNLAVVTPWEIWAYRHTAQWIPLSTGGLPSVRDGITCFTITKGYRRPLDVPAAMQAVVNEAITRWQEGKLDTLGELVAFLGDQLHRNPLGVLELLWTKVHRAWYGTDAQHREEWIILFIQSVYLLLSLWGGWMLWRHGRNQREWLILVTSVVLYFWGMTVLVLSIVRYMIPVMGLLFPSIALAVEKALTKFSGTTHSFLSCDGSNLH